MRKFAPPFFRPRAPAGVASAAGRPFGDPQTLEFQRLILPHLDGAYNLARFLTRDSVMSEDVVQDAMIRAFRAFGQFRGGSPRAWLFTIVRNCCRTAQAGHGGAVALVISESSLGEDGAAEISRKADPGPTPHDDVERQQAIDKVREAVEAMPEPFREAVVLRDLEELSYAEIAEVTGVPVGTVMSRLARGRAMLAKELLPPANIADEQSRSAK